MPYSLEEDGGSGEVCVVKRNGHIPAGGLTAEFLFAQWMDTTLAGKTPISDNVVCEIKLNHDKFL